MKGVRLAFGMPKLKRTFVRQEGMPEVKREQTEEEKDAQYQGIVEWDTDAPNLVSSLLEGEPVPRQKKKGKGMYAHVVTSPDPDALHGFCVDIDLPCALVESSPGKYHLYIEKEIRWDDYQMLLEQLANCGIVEEGYVRVSRARGATFLRKHVYDRFFVQQEEDIARMVDDIEREILEGT